MLFYSTNKISPKVTFEEAIFLGQAPDKGLYMPQYIPTFSTEEINRLKDLNLAEIGALFFEKFLSDEIDPFDLKVIAEKVFNFDIPIEKVNDNFLIARLDQGPTASFKDFGGRSLARFMEYFLKKQNRKITILVATSGDTGSAIAHAFYGMENIKVVILFPIDEVVPFQRKQMTTLDKNIFPIAVKGKFDDCQTFVKRAFADPDLKHLNLTSANSINIGRLLPQSVYYLYLYSRLITLDKKIIFSVPSGNLGNVTAGIIAKRMGLNIEKFVVAVNENDVFYRFLKTHEYRPAEMSKNSISNAMNVGKPNNILRIVDFYGGHIDETGNIRIEPDYDRIHNDIIAYSISDTETIDTIVRFYNQYHTLIEPHGAVAICASEKYLSEDSDENVLIINLETAHPGKFPEVLESKLGIKVPIPMGYDEIEDTDEKYTLIDANYNQFLNVIS
ncbi:MAG: threonine synthase [Candidatus Dojkabacteria bacterium]|nr:threonine synthase [Candidatus Dojkabacteria bacterium]